MMRSRLPRLALVFLALVGPALSARADEHRDAGRHFTLTLPDGWGPVGEGFLAAANELGRPAGVRYAAGFGLRDRPAGAYPYVLVEARPQSTAGATYDEIERGLAAAAPEGLTRSEGALQDLVRNIDLGAAVLDRSRDRVVMRLSLDVPGVGKVQGVSYGLIGADGVVFLHCYDRDADFADRLPTFNALADSFRYDPGHTFTPGTGATRRGMGPGGLGAVAGAAGAVLGAGVWVRRRQARSTGG